MGNAQRLRVLQARNDAVQSVLAEAKQRLLSISANKTTYRQVWPTRAPLIARTEDPARKAAVVPLTPPVACLSPLFFFSSSWRT